MHYIYILKSVKNDRLYIGTSENVQRRLRDHNAGKNQSTRPYVPYLLIHSECYQDKKDALHRERQIKRSGKIRDELKKGIYKLPSSRLV